MECESLGLSNLLLFLTQCAKGLCNTQNQRAFRTNGVLRIRKLVIVGWCEEEEASTCEL